MAGTRGTLTETIEADHHHGGMLAVQVLLIKVTVVEEAVLILTLGQGVLQVAVIAVVEVAVDSVVV
jgi:hypothetical protein